MAVQTRSSSRKRKPDDENSCRKVAGGERSKNKAAVVFPTYRVTRIVKSATSHARISAEAIFLINKASEKFITLLTQEAFASASEENNDKIEYKHLSSLIPKDKKYEFLTDIVPMKVRAADALNKVPMKVRAADALNKVSSSKS